MKELCPRANLNRGAKPQVFAVLRVISAVFLKAGNSSALDLENGRLLGNGVGRCHHHHSCYMYPCNYIQIPPESVFRYVLRVPNAFSRGIWMSMA